MRILPSKLFRTFRLRTREVEPDFHVLNYGYLHIGKTGGSTVRKTFKALKASRGHQAFAPIPHRFSMQETLAKQPALQLSFIYRDPAERFVSGFNSHLRASVGSLQRSRIRHRRVFRRYATANHLAEALCNPNPVVAEKAKQDALCLPHLRRGYAYYFGSVAIFEAHRQNIYCAFELSQMNDRIPEVFAPLGIPPEEVYENYTIAHAAPPEQDSRLHPDARAALKHVWPEEFTLYEHFKSTFGRG